MGHSGGGAKLEERRSAAKAVTWMVPLCPMESVAPVPVRSLRCGNDPVEEISKPVATGLTDVSTTRRVSMEKSSTDDQLMNLEVLHPNA
ncbi:MAG: hypothetical protein ACJ746_25900, partial [Bryobacteraceae bacterium]